MSLDVTVDDRALQDYLRRLLAKTGNLSPVMSGIGKEMETRVSARFETKRDPSGQAWAPWSPFTVATYPKNGNGTLLDRYGDMLKSLSHVFDRSSATIGFGTPYAAFHEFGTKTMERRGLLTEDPETGELAAGDEQAILNIASLFLDGA